MLDIKPQENAAVVAFVGTSYLTTLPITVAPSEYRIRNMSSTGSSFVDREIEKVAADLGVALRVMPKMDSFAVYRRIAKKFAHPGHSALYERLIFGAAMHGADGWRHVALLKESPVILLLEQGVSGFVFESSSDLETVLASTQHFVFYVTDLSEDYVMCFNESDVLVVSGSKIGAVINEGGGIFYHPLSPLYSSLEKLCSWDPRLDRDSTGHTVLRFRGTFADTDDLANTIAAVIGGVASRTATATDGFQYDISTGGHTITLKIVGNSSQLSSTTKVTDAILEFLSRRINTFRQ